MIRYLELSEILQLNVAVIADFGGIQGIRDLSRLKSLVESPKQNIFGQEQYKTIHEKAVAYLRNCISDHPFLDGNKRTAVTCSAIFLSLNNVRLTASPKELEDFAVKIAVDHLSVEQIADWLNRHST